MDEQCEDGEGAQSVQGRMNAVYLRDDDNEWLLERAESDEGVV